jgi:hypothetical protein
MRYFILRIVIEEILQSHRCSGCGKGFYPEDVEISGVFRETAFISLFCRECRLIMTVCASDRGHRILKRDKVSPLTQDEIIGLMDEVKNLKGGFESLFYGSEGV